MIGAGIGIPKTITSGLLAIESWDASSGALPSWLSASGGANGTRLNSSNLIVAATAPRFDFGRGLLYEPASTNLTVQSAFAASWTTTRATLTPAAVTGPDGGTTGATLISDATASNTHLTSRTIAFTAGQTYTFSVLLKQTGPFGWAQLRLTSPAFGVTPIVNVNIGTGVLGTVVSAIRANIAPYPNGYYLVEVTALATVSTNSSIQLYLSQGDSGTVFNGDNATGVIAWGAQVEALAYASSRILTGAATVTRTADALSATAYQTNRATVLVKSIATGVRSTINLAQLSDISSLTSGVWIEGITIY